MATEKRYVIAGGSGMIGQALAHSLVRDGHEVIILTRSPRNYRGPGMAEGWDGKEVDLWAQKLEGAAGVINLAGKNPNCRWTQANQKEINASRVHSVLAIGEAIRNAADPPPVWVQVTGVGIYGDRGDETLTELSDPGDKGNFLVRTCLAWEGALQNQAGTPGRKVVLRMGAVLGRSGGAFPILRRLTRLFLGGSLGTGSQWFPWIHIADCVRLIRHGLDDESMSGIYNAVAPEPVTNRRFMQLLRKRLHRPWAPPAPALAARLGAYAIGYSAAPALDSQRVEPRRLDETTFTFSYPTPAGALDELTGR